jgi:hypothetical protein
MRRLAGALDHPVRLWDSFAVGLLVGRSEGAETVAAYHLHFEGCYEHHGETRLDRTMSRPEVWQGWVTTDDLRSALAAWADQAPGTLGELSIAMPDLGPMAFTWFGEPDITEYVRIRRQCGSAGLPVNGWWIVSISAQSVSPTDRSLQNEFVAAPARLSMSATEFSLHFLGRDLSLFNSPQVSFVLPGSHQASAEWEGADRVRVNARARRPLDLRETWASATVGAWDLSRPRSTRWNLFADDPDWEEGTQVLPAAPGSRIYIGRRDDIEMVLSPPAPTTPQPAKTTGRLLDDLYARSGQAMDAVLQPKSIDKHSAPNLELLVRNLLADAGIPVIDVGHDMKLGGIDAIAIDTTNAVAHVISVTLGHDIERKSKDLAGNRSVLAPALLGWSLQSWVISALPRADLPPKEIAAAVSLNVRTLSRDELTAFIADRTTLKAALGFTV